MNKEQAFRETAEGAIEDHRATIEAVRRFIRPTEQQMTEMVIRFLAFPLPKPVITDACALCQSRANRHSRSLFSFDEAKELLEFVVPTSAEVPPYIVSAERIMELWNECIDEAGSNIIRFAAVLIQEDRKGRK